MSEGFFYRTEQVLASLVYFPLAQAAMKQRRPEARPVGLHEQGWVKTLGWHCWEAWQDFLALFASYFHPFGIFLHRACHGAPKRVCYTIKHQFLNTCKDCENSGACLWDRLGPTMCLVRPPHKDFKGQGRKGAADLQTGDWVHCSMYLKNQLDPK